MGTTRSKTLLNLITILIDGQLCSALACNLDSEALVVLQTMEAVYIPKDTALTRGYAVPDVLAGGWTWQGFCRDLYTTVK